jgi:hypothetical protein
MNRMSKYAFSMRRATRAASQQAADNAEAALRRDRGEEEPEQGDVWANATVPRSCGAGKRQIFHLPTSGVEGVGSAMKKNADEEKRMEIIGGAFLSVAKKDPALRKRLLEILLRSGISQKDMRGISQLLGIDCSDDRQKPKCETRRTI